MNTNAIKNIVIVGGGTAGWMAASFLAKRLGDSYHINLIESKQIGIIGVGEATVPWIRTFLEELEINEQEFIRATNASFKLGIEFCDWYKKGEKYFHPFASFGTPIAQVPFHHYWMKLRKSQKSSPIDNYSIAVQLARSNKFALPKANESQPDATRFNYAFHFDAGLFAEFLKTKAIALGIQHIEATVENVVQDATTGNVTQIQLDTQEKIEGDFFIDCSGFRGLLIEETLHTGYENWSHWLPCNTALAGPSKRIRESIPSYTQSRAKQAGWQWRIPLQNRTGNGYVYCSDFISEDEATVSFLKDLGEETLAAPRKIDFVTGIRKKTWHKNVFSLGLSSGFLEPLESTSIYLVQLGLQRLYKYFPQNHSQLESLSSIVNTKMRETAEQLRNFIIAHYCLNQRMGEAFWDYCRNMQVPDDLQARLNEYKQTASISLQEAEFFRQDSWLAILSGYDFLSDYWHPKIDNLNEGEIEQELQAIKQGLEMAVQSVPAHESFLKKIC